MSLEENVTPGSSPDSDQPVEKMEAVQPEAAESASSGSPAEKTTEESEQTGSVQSEVATEAANTSDNSSAETTEADKDTPATTPAPQPDPAETVTAQTESTDQTEVTPSETEPSGSPAGEVVVAGEVEAAVATSSDSAAGSSQNVEQTGQADSEKKEASPPPRVTLNPVGADQAKAVPSISSSKQSPEKSDSDSTDSAKPVQDAGPQAESAAEAEDVSAQQVPVHEPVEIPGTEQLDSDLEAQLEAAMQGTGTGDTAEGNESATVTQPGTIDMPRDDAELEPGMKLKGKVDAIDEENIVVDIGYRMSGILNRRNLEGVEAPAVGETIDVVVGSVDQQEGLVHLTMPKAIHRAGGDWNAIAVGQVVECTVEKTNKGGLSVMVSQLRGFMPAGQVDLHFVGDLEPYVGQKMTAKVSDVDPKKKNLVVSRKAILQEEREQQAAAVWENLTEGDRRTGTVKTIKDYGAFVDIGGVDGLLHVREIGWTRIGHPSDVLKQGQQIEVKVLKIDRENKKISLGMKQLLDNPWDYAEQKFPKNTVVRGVVKKITDFGAFVEIEEGLEGLIHISELDFRRVNKVSDVLKEGEEVEAQVLEINRNKQRISLSMKALKPKPQLSPEKIAQREAEAAEQKKRREEAEKRRMTLKGGNTSDQGGGLFGNPGDFSN